MKHGKLNTRQPTPEETLTHAFKFDTLIISALLAVSSLVTQGAIFEKCGKADINFI
jgi:hypothetical protein